MRIRMARRVLWLSVAAALCLTALAARVFYLQVMQGPALARQAISQRTERLPLQMRRGAIYDRNGVALTDPQSVLGLAAFPRLFGDTAAVAESLADALGEEAAARVLEYVRRHHEAGWVIEGLSPEAAERVAELGLPGLAVGPTGRRYGPDSLARHLVGYANALGGQTGLEFAYDAELRGENVPHLTARYDGRGGPLPGGALQVVLPLDPVNKEPYDLHTSIDARIQRVVEEEMDRTGHPTGGPLRAGVVVMDAATGEPLAIASRPNYDQAVWAGENELRNRALTPYETGSVFKPLVAAAALEAGLIAPDEQFVCSGTYRLGDRTFRDVDGTPQGPVTLREAIARSCNTAFIQIGYERMGGDAVLEAARLFGLGEATGALPPGHEPVAPLPEPHYGGDVAQLSFGQGGLKASPLQVARAYTALANGGTLHPARLVTAVKRTDGAVVARPRLEPARRVVSRATAAELQAALLAATVPGGEGTGQAAWLEGVGAAGKSGSADTVMNGRPATHAWFAGWFPAQRPRYVVVVLIEDGRSGGTFAAPLFRRIAERILELE
ncbi:cell division protein FtsI/penicillin-binding protein 2 [Symbiobacterium terraclitae]|uniref:Cell division protein FtsI/penicillin-binding protein 2 n=1 Tax=Symbiobacterium terraclitae TaxID=557451 RepID=A0ABS4JU45_9FIRM|nr:penicillin-binding protein 2 [Symbiobacterium terraclitae]MBP2018486.1 cell division protein FtsI/penicillin-binding protein 2 [Symbiobacterium terraclitae]